MVRVVNVGDEDVSHIVHISIEGSVWRQNAGFHHVAQDVDSLVFC